MQLINKLGKEHRELKAYRRGARLGKTAEKGIRNEEKLAELKALMKSFFKRWPESYPHNDAKCQLPPHPACIQVLERPPMVMPTEDMGPITQR
eukprot:c40565_g1_i1 orf=3-278(-)